MKKTNYFSSLRFYVAVISTWILNLNIFGFSLRKICSPGFNCHGCPLSTCACPIGALTYGSAIHQIPLIAIASILAIGLILGRLICSFVCPFGLFQDILQKLPLPKVKLPKFLRYIKYIVLVLLVFLFPYFLGFEQSGFLAIEKPELDKNDDGNIVTTVTVKNLGGQAVKGVSLNAVYIDSETKEQVFSKTFTFPNTIVPPGKSAKLPEIEVPNNLSDASLLVSSKDSTVKQTAKYQLYFCKICPLGTMTASLPAYFFSSETSGTYNSAGFVSLRFIIFVVFIILILISARPFCRILCPLGAIYALTSTVSVASLKIDKDTCINCGQCDKVCPVDLDVRNEVGKMECIACGECIKVCPKNCISRVNTLKKPVPSE